MPAPRFPILLACSLLLVAAVARSECFEYRGYLGWLAGDRQLDDIADVVVLGDHALVTHAGVGLRVYNLADPADPVLLDASPIPQADKDLARSGDLLVAAGDGELAVLAVSDPTSPVVLHDEAVAGDVYDVSADGSLVCRALRLDDRIELWSATESALTFLGFLETPDRPRGVAVTGDLVLVACEDAGLLVVDAAEPANPEIVATVADVGVARFVTVHDGLAYVGDVRTGGGDRLQILDLADPAQPVVAASLDLADDVADVAVRDDLVFVSTNADGLVAYDVKEPAAPRRLGATRHVHGARRCATLGDHVVLVGDGLDVIDAANPHSADPAVPIDLADGAFQVAVDGDLLAAAIDWAGFALVDVADPHAPSVVATADPWGSVLGVALQDDVLYLAAGAGSVGRFLTYDVSDPAAPVGLASIPLTTWGGLVHVHGDQAYVGQEGLGDWGFWVIDVADPASPSVLSDTDLPVGPRDMTRVGAVLYVCDGGPLTAWDVSDGSQPVLLGSLDDPAVLPEAVAIDPTTMLAYASAWGRVHVIDVADPAAMVVVGEGPGSWAPGSVVKRGDLVYEIGWELLILDVTDPVAPTYVAAADLRGVSGGILGGDWLHAGSSSGVLTLPVQCDLATAAPTGPPPRLAVAAAPNPFNPSTDLRVEVLAAGPVRLEVFDLRGRRVRTLAAGWRDVGVHRLRFDGRDAAGRLLGSGTYLVRLRAGGQTALGKIVLAR